ncbi:MAG: PAS domain S-box protein [Acidobacteriia bacterium]|nr:PAS domain S-box protein [Terriglobia bacterium]
MKKSAAKAQAQRAVLRRQSERLAVELAVAIKGVKRGVPSEQTKTLDLSRGGVSFFARRTYRHGMRLRVSFLEVQDLSPEIREVPAQVVRVLPARPGQESVVAVRFGDVERANLIFGELLRARTRTSSALLGIIQALSPGAELETVIEEIRLATQRAMDAERVLLFLRDPQAEVLRARTADPAGLAVFRVSLGEGLVGRAAAAGPLTNVPSLAADPRYRPDLETYFDEHTHSVLCIPLLEEDGVSPGVLVIMNKRYGPFTREDEALGQAVATQISSVLREARLFESIRNLKNYNERILESIATGILTFDPAGKLTTVNRAGSEIFGLRASAEAGKGFATLFDSPANARIKALTEDVLTKQHGRAAYDVRFLRGDGSNLSLNLSGLPLEDAHGKSLGGVLVAEDITQEQRMMSTLCRYMAREVAEHLLQNKERLKLGGTRAEVTILFTDIRNFTSISEQLDPWDVVNLLNAYFPRMINVIFHQQGMVDKFIGDAILAVFGVPFAREDDALRAARAALEMRRELRAVNRERSRKGKMTVEMGIGITSGTVVSGNIGSERRMDYTVIGDPVNLAARLEGLTKEVQRRILINERVHAAIAKEIPCESLGLFAVKGKKEKVPVFAIETQDEES